jgi:septal ring factor EnvC (AmiA/AmiB activator)
MAVGESISKSKILALMTAITENYLKRLEDLIVNGQSEIKSDIKSLSAKLENIDKRLISIETRLEDWKTSINKTADLAPKSWRTEKLETDRSCANYYFY